MFQSPESLPRPSQPPTSPCMSQSEQLGLPAARTVAMLRDSRLRMFSLGPTKAHGSQHSNGHSKAGRKQTWHQRKRVTIATTMKTSSVRAQQSQGCGAVSATVQRAEWKGGGGPGAGGLSTSIYLETTQVTVIKLGQAGYNATKSRL